MSFEFNPNGNIWAKSNNFGKNMLKKLGWNEGLGLGKDCQGMQSHVKVAVKMDKRCIGHKTDNLKNGIDMMQCQNFDYMLKTNYARNFGDCNGMSIDDEDKSRRGLSRAKYGRGVPKEYFKGISINDWNSILGKQNEVVDANMKESSVKMDKGNIIESELSIEAYFQQKMMKRLNGSGCDGNISTDKRIITDRDCLEKKLVGVSNKLQNVESAEKNKTKKCKSEERADDNTVDIKEEDTKKIKQDGTLNGRKKSSKKEKEGKCELFNGNVDEHDKGEKRKDKICDVNCHINIDVAKNVDSEIALERSRKKKLKRSASCDNQTVTESIPLGLLTNNSSITVLTVEKKKKKKKNSKLSNVAYESGVTVSENPSNTLPVTVSDNQQLLDYHIFFDSSNVRSISGYKFY